MTVRRVAIIGMNNPYGPSPRHALWPDPPGCTGWRLWKMTEARTGATQADYVRAFHRYNLVDRGGWDVRAARERWLEIEKDLISDFDTLVLLGASVRRATRLLLPEFSVSPHVVTLPHPSGLNRWYNSALNRQLVELVMEELYVGAVSQYDGV